MKATTDFGLWLAENAPETVDDIYNLYRAVTDRTSMAQYKVSKKGARTFVRVEEAGTCRLLIANSDAKTLFLKKVYELRRQIDPKGDPSSPMEGWYDYYRNQRNG